MRAIGELDHVDAIGYGVQKPTENGSYDDMLAQMMYSVTAPFPVAWSMWNFQLEFDAGRDSVMREPSSIV